MDRIDDARSTAQAPFRLILTALLGASLLGAVGCATSATAPTDMAAFAGGYRVAAPDQLDVVILPDPAIERKLVVRPDGMISIDLIGDVNAAGRAPTEIAAEIQERISRFKRGASVTVSVTAARSQAITVLGEVLSPSTFPIERETRVAEAIGLVRGTTNFAATNRIRVVRYSGEQVSVFRVDLDAIKNGDYTSNVRLRGGDLIVVPRTVSATIGYALQGFFFPFQQIFGFGTNVATTVIGGV